LTQKDISDLRFGVKLGVDMVALSFVRTAEDLREARWVMNDAGAGGTPLIAKLERQEAIHRLDDIVKVSQGVRVARGDMGREAERIGTDRVAGQAPMVPIVEVPRTPHAQALCEAAVTLADHSEAYAIVAITRLGNAARVLSALRPRTPVLAATETEAVARQLTIYRGVVPLVTGIGKDIDTTGELVREELRRQGLVPAGSVVVFVSATARLERADA